MDNKHHWLESQGYKPAKVNNPPFPYETEFFWEKRVKSEILCEQNDKLSFLIHEYKTHSDQVETYELFVEAKFYGTWWKINAEPMHIGRLMNELSYMEEALKSMIGAIPFEWNEENHDRLSILRKKQADSNQWLNQDEFEEILTEQEKKMDKKCLNPICTGNRTGAIFCSNCQRPIFQAYEKPMRPHEFLNILMTTLEKTGVSDVLNIGIMKEVSNNIDRHFYNEL